MSEFIRTLERLQSDAVLREPVTGRNDTKTRKVLYLACLEFDFSFTYDEVEDVKKGWDSGMTLADIATAINRPDAEVLCLLIDFSVKGAIEPRARGMF